MAARSVGMNTRRGKFSLARGDAYDAGMVARAARAGLSMGPLAGATVVVTRPALTAPAVRRRVVALGGSAIALPGLALRCVAGAEAVAARRALRDAARADVVVFVSPAAVRFAWMLVPTLRFRRDTFVCAPGAGSVRALQRRGVRGAVCPAGRQDSEGLLALDQLANLRRRRVVLIGAEGGRGLLPRELRARGAHVDAAVVYQRLPPRLSRRPLAALAQAPGPLIALFSSAEALVNLHACLPPPLFARLAAHDCVASSARIGEVARTLGLTRVHRAAGAAPAALLDEACRVLALHRL
jgi:uroporphyrinogen-III synthase